jgi:apoptosis-inducing factor 2
MLCTGQSPNTGLLKSMDLSTINTGDNLAHVLRTMQLAPVTFNAEEDLSDTPYPHIFVVGDSADAFGAIQAGHTAWFQVCFIILFVFVHGYLIKGISRLKLPQRIF